MRAGSQVASSRSRQLVIGVATSTLSRGLAAVTPLVIVPVSLNYLGAEGYGAWAATLSLTSMLLFADLGIGSGLMTRLGQLKEDGAGGAQEARQHIASAYALVMTISATSIGVLILSAPFISWERILGGDSDSRSTEGIFLVAVSAFLVNISASLITRIQYGLGQQGRSNLWQALGSLLGLITPFLAARSDPGRVAFVAVAAFAPAMAALLNTLQFFCFAKQGRELRPDWSFVSGRVLRELISLGGRFLLITVLMTVATQSDPWIVGHAEKLSTVPQYVIPSRIFSMIGTVGLMLTLPLWPMHAQAVGGGDIVWIRRITRRMTMANTAVIGGLSLAAVAVGPAVVRIWLSGEVSAPAVLWWGLASLWVAQAVAAPAFMLQNGAEVLREQTYGYGLLAVLLPLKIWACAEFGYQWLPVIGAVAYVLIIWPACWQGYRRALRRAEHFEAAHHG